MLFVFAVGVGPGEAASKPWQRCGTVQTKYIAFYEVKAKHSSCRSAAKVARKWNRKVLKNKCTYTSCSALGFNCVAVDIRQTQYYTSYKVKCQRGIKHVNWTISLDWGSRGLPRSGRPEQLKIHATGCGAAW